MKIFESERVALAVTRPDHRRTGAVAITRQQSNACGGNPKPLLGLLLETVGTVTPGYRERPGARQGAIVLVRLILFCSWMIP